MFSAGGARLYLSAENACLYLWASCLAADSHEKAGATLSG